MDTWGYDDWPGRVGSRPRRLVGFLSRLEERELRRSRAACGRAGTEGNRPPAPPSAVSTLPADDLQRFLALPPSRRRWSLRYELNFPAADHAQLPFHRLPVAPGLIIALHTTLGPGYTPLEREAAAAADGQPTFRLILFEMKV